MEVYTNMLEAWNIKLCPKDNFCKEAENNWFKNIKNPYLSCL